MSAHHQPKPQPCSTGGCLPNCNMETAMETIVNIYHQYAPRQFKDDYLSLKDMTELLQCQAPTFLAACNRSNPKYIPHLFKQCDVNNDRNLSFEEFIKVLCLLADDAHRISHNEERCGPDKD